MDFPKIIVSAGVTTAFAMVIVGQHCHLFPNPYVGARSVCEITAPHEFYQPELNLTSSQTNNTGQTITMSSSASLSSVTGTSNFSSSPSSEF
jgi:hypothetical protein